MKRFFSNTVYAVLVRPWLRYIIGVKFKNRAVFKDIDQYIIVANHNSHFDTVSIMAALPPKKRNNTHAVAAREYFGKSGFTTKLMSFFFNATLIWREHQEGRKKPLVELDEVLKEGQSLVIFPEGTRGHPGVIKDFHHGIAVLLKQNPNVPFIPVYLDGFGRVLPKDAFLIIPLNCTVRFGSPIHPTTKSIEEITAEVRDAIFGLKNMDERDYNNFQFE